MATLEVLIPCPYRCDYYRRESETVARCATLGRSQDVCRGSRFTVESERCVVTSRSRFERLAINEEEEESRGC